MKKGLIFCMCIALCLLAVSSCTAKTNTNDRSTATTISQSEWELAWQDDFVGTQLDVTKWTLCKRGKDDWNKTMSDDPRLLKVYGGVLHLRGIINDRKDDTVPYLTAGVTGKDKFVLKYGKIQIKARFKNAQGAWPALWMLGAEGRWPAKGEIDLMEHLNFDNYVYQTVHSDYTETINKNTPKSTNTAEIKRDDWNTYGCEWDANKIVFTVNDKPTYTYPRMPEKGEKQWPFIQPFHFILSMQIGGKWVNASGPTNPAHYPAGMEIDWVRMYSRKTPSNKPNAGDG